MDISKSDSTTDLPIDEEALLDLLRREAAYEHALNQRQRIWFLPLFALMLVGFIGRGWSIGKSEALQVVFNCIQGLGGISLSLLSLLIYLQSDRRRKFRCELLEKLKDDMRAIGSLVMLASEPRLKEEVAPLAGQLLKELLPSLRADDAPYFLPGHHMALLKLLGNKDSTLVLVVLKALEQIGDERALVPVERLAAKTKYPAVQQAAQECLPYLQTRAQEKERALTLLRPSDAGPIPETLLRPTSSATDNMQEQLLRPTE
ncbi:MAG TPA: HEAT repeat domain-containing protein [Chthonomonadaceae bacterium]|nr:HEAT repeat domain-containing protein [Chthonomonadaceae bacterium]